MAETLAILRKKINPKKNIELVAWSSGTDEQIAAMVQGYYDGDVTLDQIQSVWKVGDVRNVSLSAMVATGVGESHRAQTVQLAIADFNHDDLTTAIGDKTKALLTWTQKNCLRAANVSDTGGSNNSEDGYMNSSLTNTNGWRGCARRTWCNNVYLKALPANLQALIKPVNKKSGTGGGSSSGTETTSDSIFLGSEIEIFGSTKYSVTGEGSQYTYYKTAANRNKLPRWSSSYSSDFWWERSPGSGNSDYFCDVYADGSASILGASGTCGLAPFGCF